MAKWAVKDKADFEARQQCFDFGAACRFVNDLAVSVKASLASYAKGFLRNFRMPVTEMKKPEQLRLNLLAWMDIAVTV